MKTNLAILMAMGLMLVLRSWAVAAEDDNPTYTNPQEAGSDFQLQGEYVGKLQLPDEDRTYGVQIIALGDGEFRLVGYRGGLPGEGWQPGDEKSETDGRRSGEGAKFVADHWEGIVLDGVLTIKGDSGQEFGQLKKVHRKSKTLGAKPPAGARILFDGTSADQFENGEMTGEKYLKANTASKLELGDHSLHIEFRTPFKPQARGQARGNSGVYIQSRYECQVLDSFGLEGKDNECGGIYQIAEPNINMCYPPLSWQTYDLEFTAARYENGEKVKNARATIRHNGVVIHDDIELERGTPGRLPEGPDPAPLYLQGHGNPVVYRNIWVVPK